MPEGGLCGLEHRRRLTPRAIVSALRRQQPRTGGQGRVLARYPAAWFGCGWGSRLGYDPTVSPAKPFAAPIKLLLLRQAAALDAGSRATAGAEAQASLRLGRLVLLRTLGKGGVGSVVAASDEPLDGKVALTLLHQAESPEGDNIQRVLHEAQAMARISHPNVVHIYDVGETGGA